MTIKQEIKAWAFVVGSKTEGFSILKDFDDPEMLEIYLEKPKPRKGPFDYFTGPEHKTWKPKQITISFKI